MSVRWTRSAQGDLGRIVDYVGKDSPRGARRVAGRIFDVADQLEAMPLSGRVGALAGTREFVVSQRPI